MPNIQQQKKRVLIATRQRNENLHYRSTVKTLTKRLETAVAAGDASACGSCEGGERVRAELDRHE